MRDLRVRTPLAIDRVGTWATALAARLTGDPQSKVEQAYRLVYGRPPDSEESRLALEFLGHHGWAQYARTLISSNEFLFVD